MNKRQHRIALGVCGLGRAFSLMLPTFLRDERVALVGACDPRETARAEFARQFGLPTFGSIEELASRAEVEAIYIASPHQLHAQHTAVAAKHGKHVLVEKPMALSLAECRSMIEACRMAGVYLIVGHCHSFDTPYLQARDIIAGDELGSVRMIQALNYTDFLYRPRRPEELDTAAGGGVVYSQAAHQVDIVRLLAGSDATRVRAATGAWDPDRPTEGAYSALLWFENGAFASLHYSGYGHFDSDEWCGGIGELGGMRAADDYGVARRRLNRLASPADEAEFKAAGTFGGTAWRRPNETSGAVAAHHQHFGPVIICCERGDLRPMPDAVWVYGNDRRERRVLRPLIVPRFEVIDELYEALTRGKKPLHDGLWAMGTIEICIALLESARSCCDVALSASAQG